MGNIKFILKLITLINIVTAVSMAVRSSDFANRTFGGHINNVVRKSRQVPSWVLETGKTRDGVPIDKSIDGIKLSIDHVINNTSIPSTTAVSENNTHNFLRSVEEWQTRGHSYSAVNWNWVYITEWVWYEMANNIGDIMLARQIEEWRSNSRRYNGINVTGHDAQSDLELYKKGMLFQDYMDNNLVGFERAILQKRSASLHPAQPTMPRVTRWQRNSCYVDSVMDFVSCIPEFVEQLNQTAATPNFIARAASDLIKAKKARTGVQPTTAKLISAMHTTEERKPVGKQKFIPGRFGEANDVWNILNDIVPDKRAWTYTSQTTIMPTSPAVLGQRICRRGKKERAMMMPLNYSATNLHAALSELFGQEEIEDYRFTEAGPKCKAIRMNKLLTAPPNIIICLSRSEEVESSDLKAQGVFKFPPILALDRQWWQDPAQAVPAKYRLTAVLMYSKEASHFWTDIRDSVGGEWYKYDEFHNCGMQAPQSLSDDKRQKEWFSRTENSVPYWLLYRRI